MLLIRAIVLMQNARSFTKLNYLIIDVLEVRRENLKI